jgi:hypothetical protein
MTIQHRADAKVVHTADAAKCPCQIPHTRRGVTPTKTGQITDVPVTKSA